MPGCLPFHSIHEPPLPLPSKSTFTPLNTPHANINNCYKPYHNNWKTSVPSQLPLLQPHHNLLSRYKLKPTRKTHVQSYSTNRTREPTSQQVTHTCAQQYQPGNNNHIQLLWPYKAHLYGIVVRPLRQNGVQRPFTTAASVTPSSASSTMAIYITSMPVSRKLSIHLQHLINMETPSEK